MDSMVAGAAAVELERLEARIGGCRRCVEAAFLTEAHPVHRGRGTVRARLMLVGQAPGATGHLHPKPFSGAAGRTLRGWLVAAGFPEDALHDGERIFLTSVTKCFPGPSLTGAGKGDRMPSPPEVRLCRPYLDAEIRLVRPDVVLALGRLAATELLGRDPLAALVGPAHEIERAGQRFRVVALSHPSGVSRWLNDPANRAKHYRALETLAALRVEYRL